MKSHLQSTFFSLSLFFLFTFSLNAQIETGFAGDNFSLEAALTAFETAKSLENFEKALNTENNHINNLDLDEDGKIDYIRVSDNMEGDVHAIVLQVPFSKTESQDIAVIEIEKTGKDEAMLQIVGDEDVYGTETIVEPFEVESKSNYRGPSAQFTHSRVIINVWFWPSVRHIYRPNYRVYASPWGWRAYPRYWKPWRPHPYSFHYRNRVVRPHFHVVKTHRVVRAHKVYMPKRRTTKVVKTRTTVVRNKNGKVVGAKRTKTVTRKNNKVKTKKSTTRTVKKNKNGKVKARKKLLEREQREEVIKNL